MVWKVAFGPSSSWVAWDDETDDIGWSEDCPRPILKLLFKIYSTQRVTQSEKQVTQSNLKLFVFTETAYCAVFQDGTTDCYGNEILCTAFNETKPHKLIVLGPNDSFIFASNNGNLQWSGLDYHVDKVLKSNLNERNLRNGTREECKAICKEVWYCKNSTLYSAALGANNTYYLGFEDGKAFYDLGTDKERIIDTYNWKIIEKNNWEKIEKEKDNCFIGKNGEKENNWKIIEKNNCFIKSVVLSPDVEDYYFIHHDKGKDWVCSFEFDDLMIPKIYLEYAKNYSNDTSQSNFHVGFKDKMITHIMERQTAKVSEFPRKNKQLK